MKKKLAILLSAVMVTGMLAACGGKETPAPNGDAAAEGKQLSVQIGPDPETVDPALNSAIDGANMIIHSFETLLIMDEETKVQPGQAETWEASEDGMTWTFHLRDGLKWSDGTPLTAKDFEYSWKRLCDPNVAAPYAETVLSMVKGFDEATSGNLDALGVSAPDDKTLVVELAQPCPYFESIVAFPAMSPVQKATIEANGDAWATTPETYVSNGPFHVTEWVPGSHIIMSKNPNYWNADAVKLGSIRFVLMEDNNASYSAFQTGEVLLAKDVPTEEIPSLKGNNEFKVDPIIGTYYISMNLERDIFKDVKVREALSLAIDREYVANTLMQGTYSPAYNLVGEGWIDPTGGSFTEKANEGKPYIAKDYKANLEKAKSLLAEAGYPNGEGFPTITYTINDAGYHKVVAEYLQQAWAELGIKLNVEVLEWSSFTPTRRSGNFDAARNGWVGDYTDPSNMLELFYSQNGNNDGRYNNPEFDKAIETARTAIDPAERSAALHKAEDIIMADAGCIPLSYQNDFWMQSDKLTGSWHSPYGYFYLMYADVAE